MQLPEVVGWLKAHPAAPAITQREVSGALERLQRDESEDAQPDLFSEVEVQP